MMPIFFRRSPLVVATCLGVAGSLLVACGSDGNSASSGDGGPSGGVSGSMGSVGGASSGGSSSGGKNGNGGASAGATSNGGATAHGGTSAGGTSNGGSGGATSSGGTSSGGTSNSGSGGATSSGGTSSGGKNGNGGAGGSGTALVNPAPGSKFFVGANFWNIDWEGQGDFFQSNVDWTTTTNPWQPALLTDLAPYHVLRFMDWNQTNDSNNPQAVWDTRKQKTQNQNEPVAFEWQIDLCNRTKKDYWLNVPHEATADYWTKLATLVKDQLDPSLRVYLEYSNEVWNAGFPQNGYAADKAKAMNLAGSIPASSYYVYASVRLYEAFEGVFGKGSPRLVKVLAGQAAWTGPCDAHMLALADSTINPKGTMPTVYAIAPYFGGKTTAELSSALPTVNQWTTDSNKCASGKMLPLVSYEGGSDSFSASNCTTVQHDPGMHDLYTSYLDGISGAGLKGPFMQYTHTGACWGLKEKTSDALDVSPKYKGVLDWLAAHP
ncbi:MAG TPA: hypothetical protein VH062_01745 [Polyangiaceae bacterium]|jgi:hypothetical protein|nr:hypothetical protein [Polyangiaceae bacterium]